MWTGSQRLLCTFPLPFPEGNWIRRLFFRAPGAMPKLSWAAGYRCRDRPNFPPFPTSLLQLKTWVNEIMKFQVKVCWICEICKYDCLWGIIFDHSTCRICIAIAPYSSALGHSAGSLKIKSSWIHFPSGKERGKVQSKCWLTIHIAHNWMNTYKNNNNRNWTISTIKSDSL